MKSIIKTIVKALLEREEHGQLSPGTIEDLKRLLE